MIKRALAATAVVVISTVLGFGAVAAAETQNQPGQGERSTGRNEAGFGGGPHCHLLAVDNAQEGFEHIRVFPSHTGHANSAAGVLIADGDCDGLP